MTAQTAPHSSSSSSTIRNVTFQNAAFLSSEERQLISNAVKKSDDPTHVRTLDDLVEEAAERTQIVYQRNGYFKAQVKAQPVAVPGSRQSDINVNVLEQGRQYHLGAIHWKGMSVVSEQELSNLMPIHPGEIMNRDRIAEGLDQIHKFYSSKGYMKATLVPVAQFDENTGNITLDIEVHEDM